MYKEAMSLYANKDLEPNVDYVLQDDSNDKGIYIKEWNVPDVPMPDMLYINNLSDLLYLQLLKDNKITDLSIICQDKIINSFYSNCLGELQRFDCELTDQIYIQNLVLTAILKMNGLSNDNLMYKFSGSDIREFTPQQIINLSSDLKNHIEKQKCIFSELKNKVSEASTEDEVSKISWED